MTRNLDSKEGTVLVTRTHLGKTDMVKDEKIRIRPFVTDTAHIAVKFSRKLQIVQYEPIGIEILVSVPCYKEELKEVYRELKDFAENLLI
jgi:hypothetical protein